MLQVFKSTNTLCLLKSLQFKQKNYEDLKACVESPNNLISIQTQNLENEIERIKNKIVLNESSINLSTDTIDNFKLDLENLKNQINKDIEQFKFTTQILDDKIRKYNENMKLNELNTMSVFKNLDNNIIKLKKYPKTTSIIVSTNIAKPLEYFYMDNKLYQNNNFGNNYSLVNGYYFIAISDNKEIINKAWDIQNGEMIELTSYFDGSNNKLIISILPVSHAKINAVLPDWLVAFTLTPCCNKNKIISIFPPFNANINVVLPN